MPNPALSTSRGTATKTIFAGNAYLVRQEIRGWDAITNGFVLASGLTMSATFAVGSDGSGPIAGMTGVPVSELSLFPGIYAATITGTATATLGQYVGQVIYQIVTGGADNAIRVVTPLYVDTVRPAV